MRELKIHTWSRNSDDSEWIQGNGGSAFSVSNDLAHVIEFVTVYCKDVGNHSYKQVAELLLHCHSVIISSHLSSKSWKMVATNKRNY